MEIIVVDSKGSSFQFPVNPQEISIKRDKKIETVDILNLGEIDFSNGQKIQEISFSSFFPRDYDSSYCSVSSLSDPVEYMNTLDSWTVSADPVRLIIPDLDINMLTLVSISGATIRGGEPGDIYFDITFRSWREIKIRTSAEPIAGGTATSGNTTSATASSQRPNTKPVDKSYLVKAGDCLYSIAKVNLGDGEKWKDIYSLNSSVIGSKPEIIQQGMELRMPA